MTPLEEFGRWCLDEMLRDCGDDIDYDGAQDKAIALGLLGSVMVAEACHEDCYCIENGVVFPAECLRETPLAKGDEP